MYEHTLRPIFTEHIFNRLLDGECLNVYGHVEVDEYSCSGLGVGKTKLLTDLINVCNNEYSDKTIILLNMNDYRYGQGKYQIFLEDISIAMGKETYFSNFGAFIEDTIEKNVILLIDNFHYFFESNNKDDKDDKFDETFIDNLNAAKRKISILVTTHKPHSHYNLCLKNTGECRSSWLDFKELNIGELTYDELTEEVYRRFPKLDENQKIKLIGSLETTLSLAIIEEFEQFLKINPSLDDFTKSLKQCRKNVEMNCKKRFKKNGNKIKDIFLEIKSWLPYTKIL